MKKKINVITTRKMPQKGQFIIVWIYNNKLWSDTVMWKDRMLFTAKDHGNTWKEETNRINYIKRNYPTLYIKKEEE
jgi:hypothetical protein